MVYSPVSGTISRVNDEVNNAPDIVNKEPYGAGWLFEVELSDAGEVEGLMDAETYKNKVESEKE